MLTTLLVIDTLMTIVLIGLAIGKNNEDNYRWKNLFREWFASQRTSPNLSQQKDTLADKMKAAREDPWGSLVVKNRMDIDDMMKKLTDFDRRHPNPLAEFERSCMPGNDNDIDHKSKRAEEALWNQANSWSEAVDCAIRAEMGVGYRCNTIIEHHDGSYRWRLEVYEGEVEPACQSEGGVDLPGVGMTPFTVKFREKKIDPISFDTQMALYNAEHPDPPIVARVESDEQRHTRTSSTLNKLIQYYKKSNSIRNAKDISDGYHTFQELYDMRLALTISTFANHYAARLSNWLHSHGTSEGWFNDTFRSRLHANSTMFDGMFIVGIRDQIEDKCVISFHYHDEHWDKFNFCEMLEKAPEWDGHTDKDVIERLMKL